MGQFATTFRPAPPMRTPAIKKNLSTIELKILRWASQTANANTPHGEVGQQRILELAAMCGGWSEPVNYNQYPNEVTLREHCIF